MILRAIAFIAVLILQSNVVLGQDTKAPSTMKVAREFSLWYYPDSFNGRRGLRFDVFDTATAQDGSVTGKATMHGLGFDRCTIRSTPVVGRVENDTLFMRLAVKDDDNLTCRTAYELRLNNDGVPEGGKYKREGGKGDGTMKRE
jgi:hypothetical protein